jgi:hypothetical protein
MTTPFHLALSKFQLMTLLVELPMIAGSSSVRLALAVPPVAGLRGHAEVDFDELPPSNRHAPGSKLGASKQAKESQTHQSEH